MRCFLAVARHLHFGRAAAAMHLSPSTLSEQIARLERRLGSNVFDRSSRHVQLTIYGQQFAPLAERAVATMQDVLTWADTSVQIRLRVGMVVSSPSFRALMGAAVRDFPAVKWEIRHLEFADPSMAIEDGIVDCAFVVDGGVPEPPVFKVLPLWREDRVLVVSKDHPLATRVSVAPQDLRGETIISVQDTETSRRWLAGVPEGITETSKILEVAQNFEEILEMCSAGLGVNIAGASAAETYNRPGLHFVPIVGVPKITTYLCWKSDSRHPGLQELVQLATQWS
nr:LysR family transcriptional regulator [Enteractinococcus helveticum]